MRRRNHLRMTQEEVKAAGGPSTATMRLIEGALQDSYRDVILGRLEDALRWEPGSVAAILSGGDPTPRTEPVPPRSTGGRDQQLDPDVRRWMAILADPTVPQAQKDLMREQMRIWEKQIEAIRDTDAGSEGQRHKAS